MAIELDATIQRLRDSFLPARLAVRAELGDIALHAERSNARRFVSIGLVATGTSLLLALLHLVQGNLPAALGSVLTCTVMVGMLDRVRRGGSVARLGLLLSTALVVSCSTLGVAAGLEGLPALYWVGLAPVLAKSFAGPRAGRVMLAVSVGVVSLALWLIFSGTAPVLIDLEGRAGPHLVSLCGAALLYYFLSLTFDREMEQTLAELRQMNVALEEARGAAERANRAKGEFLAMMSHEIRTPLNGVLGMTSVMLSSALPSEVREGLGVIQQSGDALLTLLNDVLDFSKIESGHLELEALPCDVRQQLATAASLLQDTAAARGNRLHVEVDPAVPAWITSDPVRLRQVVLNLVSNAVKFTQGGRIDVRATADGERLLVEVRDTGIGMRPEVVAQLFRPFTQADASTTRRFGGTGLGLAIVQRIVDAMGGSIQVDTGEGAGSTFRVALPLLVADAPRAPAPRAQPTSTRALTVLVAEDNRVSQRIARHLLEQLGHQVLLADDGTKVLELVDAHAIDLVLMDCHMPAMDGFEATRRLREQGRRLPIVALTAAALPEEARRCLDAGMNEVLVKPVQRRELETLLQRVA